MIYCLTFGEIEHEGDLERIHEDIANSGGTVLKSTIDSEDETAEVYVEVKGEFKQFQDKFKETESYGFL